MSYLATALVVAGFDPLDRTWAFLVELGLVGNRLEVRRHLERAIAEAIGAGLTGPDQAERVASRLREAGSITVKGAEPDPGGRRASAAFADFIARGEPVAPPIPAIFDEAYCRWCGRVTPLRYSTIDACQHCGKPPVALMALAIELGYSSATCRPCPRCARANCFDRYCYYCGLAQEA